MGGRGSAGAGGAGSVSFQFAASSASLPDDTRYSAEDASILPVAGPAITAFIKGKPVGSIEWVSGKSAGDRQGEVRMILVSPKFQRQGIATRMFDAARKVEPRLHHSNSLTGKGAAFAKAEQSRRGIKANPKATSGDL